MRTLLGALLLATLSGCAHREALLREPERLPPGAIARIGTTTLLVGPREQICALAFSPSGREVAAGGSNGTIRVWDPRAPGVGRRLERTLHLRRAVRSLVYSSDGLRLIAGGSHGEIKEWDVASGELLRVVRVADDILGVATEPGGAVAWVARDASAGVLQAGSWEQVSLRPAHPGWFGEAVALLPGGRAAIADSSGLHLHDTATGAALDPSGLPQSRLPAAVACSRTGTYIALSRHDEQVDLRTADGGTKHIELGTAAGSIAFAPDEAKLALACSDGVMRVWDHQAGTIQERRLTGSLDAVAWSPDATLIAAETDGVVRLLDATSLSDAGPEERAEPEVNSLALSPDGRILAAGHGDGRVTLVSVAGWAPLGTLAGGPSFLQDLLFLDPSRLCVVGGDGGRRLDLLSGGFPQPLPLFTEGCPFRLAPAGGLTAVGRTGGATYIQTGESWETGGLELLDASGALVRRLLEWRSVSSLASDGLRLVAGLSGGAFTSWKLGTWETEWTVDDAHDGYASALALAPDGSVLVSGGRDGTIRVRSCDRGTELRSKLAHQGRVGELVFLSPTLLASCGADDGAVRLWDARTLALRGELFGHAGGVSALVLIPAAGALASGGDDGTVVIWDVRRLLGG